MKKNKLAIYILAWIPMVFIAILNGTVREFVYRDMLTELISHQLSTISAIVFFGIYISIIMKKIAINSSYEALFVGFIWLILTIMFEFGFGHYIAGNSWQSLLADYNIFQGRVWVFVLIFIFIAPLLFYYLRDNKK